MKGKIGFVVGAAVGYVLGTRAGRQRYEQIKRGAAAVWETPLVQQGVDAAKGTVGNLGESVKTSALKVAKNVFDAATQARTSPSHSAQANSAAAKDAAPGEGKSL